MKTLSTLSLAGLIIFLLVAQTASAQIPRIKIPKAKPQPTPEAQPTPDSSVTPDSSTNKTPATQSTGAGNAQVAGRGGPYVVKPEPPANPLFLADTLKIDLELWDYYYKVPNDNHNTSWAPRIGFDVLYGGSTKLRYKAEYFMPDGSLWFSEPLEQRGSVDSHSNAQAIYSQDDSNSDKRAIVVGGVFGLKITNIRDNSVAFQGKFKIVRYKPQYSDARYRNEVDYYVDYDWKLPIGLADLYYERDMAVPIIRMWFKGDLNNSNFEARLFRNGQQIATTDEEGGGGVDHGDDFYAKRRGDDKALFWREFKFSWPKKILFIRTEEQRNYTAYEKSVYINQMPGEYVVKVYYNGDQVRETKFSIGNNGTYADNGIAKQNNLATDKVILPVRVMGTLDKWNPVNAKSGFYGNPVAGLQ